MDRLELLDPRFEDFSRDMDDAGHDAFKIAEVFGRYAFLWNQDQPQQGHEETISTDLTRTTSQRQPNFDSNAPDSFLSTIHNELDSILAGYVLPDTPNSDGYAEYIQTTEPDHSLDQDPAAESLPDQRPYPPENLHGAERVQQTALPAAPATGDGKRRFAQAEITDVSQPYPQKRMRQDQETGMGRNRGTVTSQNDNVSKQPVKGSKLRNHVPDNVKLPADMQFTIVEICRFLPKCFHRPIVMERALLNGFDCWTLAEMEMAGFNDYDFKDLHDANERYKHSKASALKILHGTTSQKTAQLKGSQDDMTAATWKLKSSYDPNARIRTTEEPKPLRQIYNSVDKLPTGNDRGVFTACLELWKENEATYPDLTTDDLATLKTVLEDLGTLPVLDLGGVQRNHDQETLARFGKRSQKTASKPDPKKAQPKPALL
ncbi:uncharacterized protein MYCFIDRAFT_194066 [Pseudocercospora fijiensis CIRAD86]|uniref:Uncharacterized protein n=1 Tax=Pseudocercospora fijiensis (strain CIRAD86) TaxID=383855 RepID=M2Z7W4_PSEFD|nr:uncharacterized protein MYCFIDRAFT_194066 [Pseudocercospora fijiensis CIRAD86]EME85855.1 hypothetical protein MYCFIDRAFT_194066 [Pseudocercospora fijiensis CIRAD86]